MKNHNEHGGFNNQNLISDFLKKNSFLLKCETLKIITHNLFLKENVINYSSFKKFRSIKFLKLKRYNFHQINDHYDFYIYNSSNKTISSGPICKIYQALLKKNKKVFYQLGNKQFKNTSSGTLDHQINFIDYLSCFFISFSLTFFYFLFFVRYTFFSKLKIKSFFNIFFDLFLYFYYKKYYKFFLKNFRNKNILINSETTIIGLLIANLSKRFNFKSYCLFNELPTVHQIPLISHNFFIWDSSIKKDLIFLNKALNLKNPNYIETGMGQLSLLDKFEISKTNISRRGFIYTSEFVEDYTNYNLNNFFNLHSVIKNFADQNPQYNIYVKYRTYGSENIPHINLLQNTANILFLDRSVLFDEIVINKKILGVIAINSSTLLISKSLNKFALRYRILNNCVPTRIIKNNSTSFFNENDLKKIIKNKKKSLYSKVNYVNDSFIKIITNNILK